MEMHHSDPFSQAFDFASGKTGDRFQNPLWQVTEIFLGKKFRESVSLVREFGSAIVSNAVMLRHNADRRTSGSTNPLIRTEDASGSLIYALLDSIDDEEIVRDAALNYLSAGELRKLHSFRRNIGLIHLR